MTYDIRYPRTEINIALSGVDDYLAEDTTFRIGTDQLQLVLNSSNLGLERATIIGPPAHSGCCHWSCVYITFWRSIDIDDLRCGSDSRPAGSLDQLWTSTYLVSNPEGMGY
jgi:hypothetical protein